MFAMNHALPRIAAVGALITLAGCASFSSDGGFGAVERTTRERIAKDVLRAQTDADRDAIVARVAALLAKPLSADDAVQVALLNNRGLQASFAELGIAEAELVQSGRLPNPRFSMLRASKAENGGREYKIEQALTINVFALVTMPLAMEMERRRFASVQQQIAIDVLRLASDTRKAYVMAVAADEAVRYLRQVQSVAAASAELARRMAQVGNWSKLNQAREQGFYADAALNVARAERSQNSAREQLTRLLGLWGEQIAFKLPERLPDLPKEAADLPDIEERAMAERLDLRAVRTQTEALAKNLGLTKATRFLNVLEFGPARVLEGERNAAYKRGYEISFEIPIFDWGSSRVAKAESIYMQAVDRAAAQAINARSEVRESYRGYRTAFDIALHYRDEVVPIRKRIADENLLRYNGMLIGVFDLLADARSQIASVNSYIESLRDFWLADADLQMARIGKPTAMLAPTAAMAQPEAAGH
ncbi:MAG: TolC family protein [Burkholderiales bacterium]